MHLTKQQKKILGCIYKYASFANNVTYWKIAANGQLKVGSINKWRHASWWWWGVVTFVILFTKLTNPVLNWFQNCCKDQDWSCFFMFVNQGCYSYYVIGVGPKKPCTPVLISLLIPCCERIWCGYIKKFKWKKK